MYINYCRYLEILSNFKKNVAEDTVSAMLILDRWKKENKG